MRKATIGIATLFALALGSGTANAATIRPPHCDPAACPNPIEIVEDAACAVAQRLGFQCID